MLRTVGAFEKHALSGIAFIDFDFSPSMMRSSPIMIVPSDNPVAVSVTDVMRNESSFTPSTFTVMSSRRSLRLCVGMRSTVRLWTTAL